MEKVMREKDERGRGKGCEKGGGRNRGWGRRYEKKVIEKGRREKGEGVLKRKKN